jgi:drug/metabolite transporter (DMT)-like permease
METRDREDVAVPLGPPHAFRHLLPLLAATMAAASNPVGIKLALSLGWPPFMLGVGRTLCVGVLFVAWIRWERRAIFGLPGLQRRWTLIASACKAISVACSFASLSLIPASRVAILSAFSPIANLLLVRLLLKDERVTAWRVAGIVLGMASVLVLVAGQEAPAGGPESGAEPSRVLAGDLIAIAGVMCVQGLVVFEKRALDANMSPQQLAAAASVVGVAVLLAMALAVEEHVDALPVTFPATVAFLYLVAVPGVFLFYTKRWLTSVLDVSFLAAFQSPERALAVALSMAVLGERVSAASFACFVVILAGTVIASRRSNGIGR